MKSRIFFLDACPAKGKLGSHEGTSEGYVKD